MLRREKYRIIQKIIKEDLVALSFMLSIPLIQLIYQYLNQAPGAVNNLVTDLDRSIPFLKIFVLPYIGWFPFMFLTLVYLCIACRDTYFKTLAALITGFLVSCAVYLVYQTTVPRPELAGNDFLTSLVALVYAHDQPYNCFPSIHSFTSFLMIKAINHVNRQYSVYGLLIKGMAVLIICSTIFIKQHVLLDAVAGVLLGEILFNSINALEKSPVYLFSDQKRAVAKKG